jgi:hypothetical protein
VDKAPVFQQSEKMMWEKFDSKAGTKMVSAQDLDTTKLHLFLDTSEAVESLEPVTVQVQRDLSIVEAIVMADLTIDEAIVSDDPGEKPSPSSDPFGHRESNQTCHRLKKPNKNIQETRPCFPSKVETKF